MESAFGRSRLKFGRLLDRRDGEPCVALGNQVMYHTRLSRDQFAVHERVTLRGSGPNELYPCLVTGVNDFVPELIQTHAALFPSGAMGTLTCLHSESWLVESESHVGSDLVLPRRRSVERYGL